MRILQVNQYYYPRGGADKYFLDLSQALEDAGHQVAVFSMQHPKNQNSVYGKYFVSRVSFNAGLGLANALKIPARVLYSFEAKRKFKQLVKEFKPEIIHLHNIYHHLSPSILSVAKKNKIPVVMHLHDYKLVCPNHMLFTGGKYCEKCRPNKYYNCLKYRCIKESFFGSLLGVFEMYFHHSILKVYEKNISLFIAPSRFMKETCVRFGWDEKKIEVVYNPYSASFLSAPLEAPGTSSDYLLYFGRLGREKGLETLLNALPATRERLLIAGSGEEEEKLKQKALLNSLSVKFLGFKSGEELRDLILKAKAVIMPSIWAENMPLSLLEAMSLNKVVIASCFGGFPEIIKNGENGLLFTPGDFRDLAQQINSLTELDLGAMQKKAGETAAQFQPAKNLAEVLAIYQRLLKL